MRIDPKTIDTDREHLAGEPCWCLATHKRAFTKMSKEGAKALKEALETPEFQIHPDEDE